MALAWFRSSKMSWYVFWNMLTHWCQLKSLPGGRTWPNMAPKWPQYVLRMIPKIWHFIGRFLWTKLAYPWRILIHSLSKTEHWYGQKLCNSIDIYQWIKSDKIWKSLSPKPKSDPPEFDECYKFQDLSSLYYFYSLPFRYLCIKNNC